MGGSSSRPTLATYAFGVTIGVAWPAPTAGATAAEPDCTVTLEPADVSSEWRNAVRVAQEHLRGGATGDCRALTISVAGDHASVLFTTIDGRRTLRSIEAPSDLAPLVDALVVTWPREDAARARVPPVPAAPEPPAPAGEGHASAPTSGGSIRLAFRGAAGARISSPGAFASPSFGLGAGFVIGPWEVSAFGVLDPLHALLASQRPTGFTLSRYAVGVAVGRRVVVGPAAVAAGLGTSVAVTQEAGSDNRDNSGAQLGDAQAGGASAAEPLAATYVGFIYPRGSSIRLRPELSAEIVASRIGRTLTIDPSLPALPWWNGAATLAIEWEPR
jgi:hypothetical protein